MVVCCRTRHHVHRLVFNCLLVLLLAETEFVYSQQAFNGPIRLERNNSISRSLTSGRVQLYINQWGNICNDRFFGIAEADVVCHQLEYTGAISYSNALTEGLGDDGLPAVLSEVSCSSRDFLVILECRSTTGRSISSSCTQDNDTTVTCYQTRIWDNPYNGQVRLTGGATSNQGLVEVYCSGQWGTVCAAARSGDVAKSACRQLGYKSLFRVLHLSNLSVSSLQSMQPIWLGDINNCPRTPCLTHCQSCPVTARTDCPRQELVTVECQTLNSRLNPEVATNTTCTLPATENGPIQLWRSGVTFLSFTSGRVQIFFDREWGNICRDITFNSNGANVICHQLGYTGASSFSNQQADSFGSDSLPILLDDVECTTSDYLVILQCSHSTAIRASCTSADDLSVTCYVTRIWDNPFNGQIRLVRGATVNRGLVEVYCNGQWGTLCSNQFDRGIVSSVCQQLGYSSRFNNNHLSITGNASQPSWSEIDDACGGSTCPTSCPCLLVDDPINCSSAGDATIECFGFSRSTCIVKGRGSSVNVGVALGIFAGVIGVILIFALTFTMNCVVFKPYKTICIVEGYDLCTCTKKPRPGPRRVQHPYENTSTSEAVPTNDVQVETNLNTTQHEEPAAVSVSSVAQNREERRSPRRPHFRREVRLPQNRGQAASSDEPLVVFMYSVGEQNQNRDWTLPTESEPTLDNDVEFTQPSNPTITKAAPPPYNTSNQYTTCGNGDENPAPNDDPPPYYYHES